MYVEVRVRTTMYEATNQWMFHVNTWLAKSKNPKILELSLSILTHFYPPGVVSDVDDSVVIGVFFSPAELCYLFVAPCLSLILLSDSLTHS